MIALLQRVSSARVDTDGNTVAAIGRGLLVLLGVERGDTATEASRMAERLLAFRVFPDAAGRMNLSIQAIQGELLLVPQFTLAADTRHGNRPGFSPAADPATGERLFGYLRDELQRSSVPVVTGVFGADMQVTLCNDGPVTFWLQVPSPAGGHHGRKAITTGSQPYPH